MLIDTIKKENMLALKNKDDNKRAVYSILINKYMLLGYELKAKGQEIKDDDLLKIIAGLQEQIASLNNKIVETQIPVQSTLESFQDDTMTRTDKLLDCAP